MARLDSEPRIADPDGFYERLIAAHRGLDDAQSALVNAKLVLLLANHIGDADVLAQAIAAAREQQPTLMLLDVSMPVMDGLEALPLVLEASPGTRVVMYSGFQEQGLAHRALDLGASVFLEKSSSLDTLADELVAVLGTPAIPAPRTYKPVVVQDEPDDPDDADAAVLRQHLERFRRAFDDAAIGMATVTLAGRLVRANAALAELLGRSTG